MIAWLVRLMGYGCVAVALVVALLDGARSVANGELRARSLNDTVQAAMPERFLALQTALDQTGSSSDWQHTVWNWLVLPMLHVPTALVCLGLGLVFLALGWRRQENPGHLQRRV